MRLRLAAFAALCAIAGCDNPPTSTSDGGTGGGCTGMADGTECGTGLLCIDEACVETSCGDGFIDDSTGEACDDGNDVAFDGCEPGTCTFTCVDDADCADSQICNGTETCTAAHLCDAGTLPDDGTTCTLTAGGDGVCRAGACVAAGCGNGVTDAGEDCDDMNATEGDGCDADCTFSCLEDLDCSDGDVCNGSEVCDVTSHACGAGTPEDCTDTSACTMDVCDPVDGCANPLIDADGDGHAATTLGACGDDCNDARADVFTGAEELCDAADNNCNGDTDEVAPTWYVDCDNDGFSASTDGSRMGCTEPPASATGCGGGWTTVRPISTATTDCRDTNANVFPGQTRYFTTAIPGTTSFDYNCDGSRSRQYTCGPSSGSCDSRCTDAYLPYDATDNPNGCRFSCSILGCSVIDWPDCGESADFSNCSTALGGCTSLRGSSRTQACR